MKQRKQAGKARRQYFTEQNVLGLTAKRKQYLVWDAASGKGTADAARGLCVLVSPSGTKSFRAVYYYVGSPKPHYLHLGRVGELPLEKARAMCREARRRARDGEDPTSDRPTHSDHFKVAVERYTSAHQIGRLGNKSAEPTKGVILRGCKEWHLRPIATLRYREIETLLEAIRDGDKDKGIKPRPYLANRLFSHLKDFFGWCVRSKLIPHSPMSDMQRPWEQEQPRNRPWFKGDAADDVLKALWKAADTIGDAEGRYIKVMILTGKRRSALAAMKWEQIKPNWFWDAPVSDVENKRLHGVPLAPLAQRILHPRQKEGLVFGPVQPEPLMRKVRKVSGVKDFIWHGLRHVAETKCAELKILPHVRDLLFDHSPRRGSGGGYDHHQYEDEMKAGAEAWAQHVHGLVTPKGVAKIR